MQFGVCTTLDHAPAVQSAGFDYVEESVQNFFKGLEQDAAWHGLELLSRSALKVPACNLLVPASLKITGPNADHKKLAVYIRTVVERAAKCDTKILVFGSAGARNIPEGFDLRIARRQLMDFMYNSAELAAPHGVTIVAEPLNKKESNVLNSVAEAMEYVNEVNHKNFQCLVDSYHLWLEDEPLENLRRAMPHIAHVHLADRDGRVAPGESNKSDYRPFFKALKEAKYDKLISVEAPPFDVPAQGKRVLEFIKRQWDEA